MALKIWKIGIKVLILHLEKPPGCPNNSPTGIPAGPIAQLVRATDS